MGNCDRQIVRAKIAGKGLILTREHRLRLPVYRRNGELLSQCNFMKTLNLGGSLILISGGASFDTKTKLEVVRNGNVIGI